MRGAAGSGLARGLRTGWYLTKVIVPLSAAVAILDWAGVLGRIGRLLASLMALFGLPGEAALPIVSGFFAGVYGGVAAASAIPLTKAQMTVLAIIVLVAHNPVVESAVQSRSGAPGWRITTVRLVVAAVLGAAAWQGLRHGDQGPVLRSHAPVSDGSESALAPPSQGLRGHAGATVPDPAGHAKPSFEAFASAWALGVGRLLLKIYAIVAGLMIAMEIARAHGLFDALQRPLRPLMRALGLSERVTFLWLTATFLGVGYGAGLILAESAIPGRFEDGDLRDLHVSIGISHALVEDTLLFMAIGANPLWVLLPRPLAAAVAVRLARPFVPSKPIREAPWLT